MDETIKTILYSWVERKIPEIIQRDISLDKYMDMTIKKIVVITGFRRVGKTYLILHLIKNLLKNRDRQEVIYINFDDERILQSTKFLTDLLPTIKQTFDKKINYLFLDEIQDMPNWSKWLRRVYDSEDFNLFVTGSSSKVSSKEMPTELRGRCLEIQVFPLSFKEYLNFKNIQIDTKNLAYSENEKAKMFRQLEEYIQYGGMPEVVLSKEPLKNDILQQYYGTVVRKDIVERFSIQNEKGLKALLQLLLNSTQHSISKLYKTLKSLNHAIGKTTVLKYINYIENSYFMRSIPIFSYKIKDQMQYPRKHYFIDNGFITSISTKKSKDYGRLYENLVAITLLRKISNSNSDVFYWKDQRGLEVDFVIKDGLTIKQLIQVCYDIADFDTRKRETTALLKASEKLNCNNLMIITRDYKSKEEIKGKKIVYTPLYEWLFDSI